ncbi:MAG: hypothetical protein AAF914_03490 [Pseudomonadota bacterium]
MRWVLAAALIAGTTAAAQDIPVFDPDAPFTVEALDMAASAALVRSDGAQFLCAIDALVDAAVLSDCRPILSDIAFANLSREREIEVIAARLDALNAALSSDRTATLAAGVGVLAAFFQLNDCTVSFAILDDEDQLVATLLSLASAQFETGLVTEEQILSLRDTPELRQRFDSVLRDLEDAVFRITDEGGEALETGGLLIVDDEAETATLRDRCAVEGE